MARALHRPTPRQAAMLATVGFVALAAGFYLRHEVVDQAAIGVACGEGSADWLCSIRRATITLHAPSAFGYAALAVALLNLLRPSVVLWSLALLAGGLGIVLYNAALSALAIAVLVLSLARPAPGKA